MVHFSYRSKNKIKSGVDHLEEANNFTLAELESMKLKELYELARKYQVSYYSKLTKKELIFAILKANAEQEGYFFMEGVLDIIQSEGFGFLRPINYSPSSEDIYISASQIRRFDLRNGDKVSGKVRPPKENERYFGLLHVEAVNGEDPEIAKQRVYFPALTPIYPESPYHPGNRTGHFIHSYR